MAVEWHTTEIGALYFFVVVRTKPNNYRVQMSSARSVPFNVWTEIAKTRKLVVQYGQSRDRT